MVEFADVGLTRKVARKREMCRSSRNLLFTEAPVNNKGAVRLALGYRGLGPTETLPPKSRISGGGSFVPNTTASMIAAAPPIAKKIPSLLLPLEEFCVPCAVTVPDMAEKVSRALTTSVRP